MAVAVVADVTFGAAAGVAAIGVGVARGVVE